MASLWNHREEDVNKMNIYFEETVWLSQFFKGLLEKVFRSVKLWKAVAGVSSSAVWLAFDLWKVTLRRVKLLTVIGTQCNAAKHVVLILASRNTLAANHSLWFASIFRARFQRLFLEAVSVSWTNLSSWCLQIGFPLLLKLIKHGWKNWVAIWPPGYMTRS